MDGVKILGGYIYIIPCYDCDNYERCLKEGGKLLIEHLMSKIWIYLFSKYVGLEIITNEEEWYEKVKKLIGMEVSSVYPIIFNGELHTLTRSVRDGLVVMIVENENERWISVGVVDRPYGDTRKIKTFAFEVATRRMPELMETDPREWGKIIEEEKERMKKEGDCCGRGEAEGDS